MFFESEKIFYHSAASGNISTLSRDKLLLGPSKRVAMTTTISVSKQKLTPPRAAAVAGVVFSALMIVGLGIVRLAVTSNPAAPGVWLTDPVRQHGLRVALQLVPFAGVAFLWLMGVLRSRLGSLEDRFFATVFLGSGLLFVAMLFAAAATATALVDTVAAGNIPLSDSATYHLARRASYTFLNVFAIKMAGVFMFSTCAMALRTAFLPRWVAFSGFGCGIVLVVVITDWEWIALLFPAWILLVSIQILVADLGGRSTDSAP